MGLDLDRCALCNQPLRFVTVFKDEVTGDFYATGDKCAKFVEDKMPYDAFLFKEKVYSAKKVTTKNGPRFVLSFRDFPAKVWDLWKQWKQNGKKPKWFSLSKYQPRDRRTGEAIGNGVWQISIWGEDHAEIATHYRAWLNLLDG